MIKLSIPGNPQGKQRPRLARGIVYTPSETTRYEELVRKVYRLANYGAMFEGEINMRIKAYFDIPKSYNKDKHKAAEIGVIRPAKKPDWDNVGKIVSDALNQLAYHDDSQIVSATVEKWYSTEPRVEIELWEVGE